MHAKSKTLHRLYDSTNPAEPDWVREGVAEFHKRAIQPFQNEDDTPPTPSSYENVVPKLFGFLPLDTPTCSKTKYGCDLRRDKCALCQNRYYRGFSEDPKGFSSTIMELHCKNAHKFHLKCIFDYWDAGGKYLHSCPTCGEMATLNYETVALIQDMGRSCTIIRTTKQQERWLHASIPSILCLRKGKRPL